MTLLELGAWFTTRGCCVGPGVDLFYGQLPDAPSQCAMLREEGGDVMPVLTDPALLWRARVQVVARGPDYFVARQLAERYYRAALALQNTAIGSTRYLQAEPDSPPYFLDWDERDYPMFGVWLDVWRAAELPN